uniref:Ion transport domain-containing protein n=1 Tax=Chromera velia CCMP2878 TaxID=1169474 RepID=A0A0G4F8D7_9ALVE|eukprot:Cvel_2963.t1-p1 / transcript=Cvel_2963.t1 / gene=Cvel_2963 / organism=Chromera_velia_CCMP2878 / gene_product=hypothetical protein / transcript_product=hypothetical protein / location=Cvel_scaffold117:79227-93907(-) / protein_length=1197 / sequence_SO=supercontig / SO=protein_coding / is_pseudo=false
MVATEEDTQSERDRAYPLNSPDDGGLPGPSGTSHRVAQEGRSFGFHSGVAAGFSRRLSRLPLGSCSLLGDRYRQVTGRLEFSTTDGDVAGVLRGLDEPTRELFEALDDDDDEEDEDEGGGGGEGEDDEAQQRAEDKGDFQERNQKERQHDKKTEDDSESLPDLDGRLPSSLTLTASTRMKRVKAALRKRAKVNASDGLGNTPLHVAVARRASSRLVSLLIEKGADVNAVDREVNQSGSQMADEIYDRIWDSEAACVVLEAIERRQVPVSNLKVPERRILQKYIRKGGNLGQCLSRGGRMAEENDDETEREKESGRGPWLTSLLLQMAVSDEYIAEDLGVRGIREVFGELMRQAVKLTNPLCFLMEQILMCKQRRVDSEEDFLSDDFRTGVERLQALCLALLDGKAATSFAERGGMRLLLLVSSAEEKEIAKAPPVRALLEQLSTWRSWRAFEGFRWHFLDMTVQGRPLSPVSVRNVLVVSLAVICSFCFFAAEGLTRAEGAEGGQVVDREALRGASLDVWGPLSCTMYLSGCHLFLEIVQVKESISAGRHTFVRHFASPWNALETMTFWLLIIAPSVGVFSDRMAGGLRTTLIVCGFALCIRSLEFLMILRHFGPRVYTVVRMTYDVLMFSFLLFGLLVIFSAAIFLLSRDYPELAESEENTGFASFPDMLFALLNSILSVSEPGVSIYDLAVSNNAVVVSVFIVLWVVRSVVMMLNFLIALMSKSFEDVEADANGFVALFRVNLWADIALMPPESKSFEDVEADANGFVALFRVNLWADIALMPPEARLPPFVAPWFFWLRWLRTPSRQLEEKRQMESGAEKGSGDESETESPLSTRMIVYLITITTIESLVCIPLSIVNVPDGSFAEVIVYTFNWLLFLILYPVFFFLIIIGLSVPGAARGWAKRIVTVPEWTTPGHMNPERAFRWRDANALETWDEVLTSQEDRKRKFYSLGGKMNKVHGGPIREEGSFGEESELEGSEIEQKSSGGRGGKRERKLRTLERRGPTQETELVEEKGTHTTAPEELYRQRDEERLEGGMERESGSEREREGASEGREPPADSSTTLQQQKKKEKKKPHANRNGHHVKRQLTKASKKSSVLSRQVTKAYLVWKAALDPNREKRDDMLWDVPEGSEGTKRGDGAVSLADAAEAAAEALEGIRRSEVSNGDLQSQITELRLYLDRKLSNLSVSQNLGNN